jgi:hypothetical protein
MPRPRFQFRLSTLLWITLAVACWFGGREYERRADERRLKAAYDHYYERNTHGIKAYATIETWDDLINNDERQELAPK